MVVVDCTVATFCEEVLGTWSVIDFAFCVLVILESEVISLIGLFLIAWFR